MIGIMMYVVTHLYNQECFSHVFRRNSSGISVKAMYLLYIRDPS